MVADSDLYHTAMQASVDLLTEKEAQIELLRAELARLRAAAAPVVRWLKEYEQGRVAAWGSIATDDGDVINSVVPMDSPLTFGKIRALARAMEPEGE